MEAKFLGILTIYPLRDLSWAKRQILFFKQIKQAYIMGCNM